MTPEGGIRARLDAGSTADAITATLTTYGPEIMSFLVAVTRDETDADDAFSLFCVALCAGLPAFRWQSSLRTWLYVLARSALGRLGRERGAARRETALSPEVAATVAQVKSSRVASTATLDRIRRIRDGLDPEDLMLLVLRVNRELSWSDVARVLLGKEELAPDEEQRAAAAARKRWQRLKDELRRTLEQAS